MTLDIFDAVASKFEERYEEHRLEWHDDPAGFARDCFKWPRGKELRVYQADILTELAQEHRVAVRSLHGAGKSATAAFSVNWFAATREAAGINWKVVTTAGAWRQLEHYLWPEIRLWANRLRFDRLGRAPYDMSTELLKLSLQLPHGQAFAVASSDATLIEGAHADEILFVFDESKAIAPEIFDAAEGALSSGEGYALSLSTPGVPVGRFYDIHARKPGFEDWKVRHVTLAQALETGQVTTQWAEQRKRQFGEHSAAYQNRVLGEFASSDEDSVIPLSWVEAAIERWKIRLTELGWEERNGLVVIPDLGPMSDLGLDPASTGDDKTVMGPKHGDVIGPLRYFSLASTMETTGYAAGILRAHEGSRAIVDVSGGLGLGVHDRLREQGLRSVAYIGQAEPTRHRDRSGELEFVNLRADAWWNLREMLDPIYFPTLCLPPDDMMIGNLCTPRRKEMQSSGKIQVESKIDIKKRLKRSPDAGDAVVQACMPRPNFRRRARMTYGGTLVR